MFGSINLESFFIMKKNLFLGGLVSGVGSAFAAVPAEVTAAISTMQADGVIVASAFLVAAIAVAAIKFLRSAK
mgnify:CR=1 FL=1